MQREDYFFEESNEGRSDRLFVLVIYDIVDNKKRVKFAKYLQGYGTRVQKSAFEAHLTRKVYEKLLNGISEYCEREDSVRIYRMIGQGMVSAWGYQTVPDEEDLILI